MKIVYNNFYCPKCMRVCTKPWEVSWCLHHDSNFTPHAPEDPETDWSRMRFLDLESLNLERESDSDPRTHRVPKKIQVASMHFEHNPDQNELYIFKGEEVPAMVESVDQDDWQAFVQEIQKSR